MLPPAKTMTIWPQPAAMALALWMAKSVYLPCLCLLNLPLWTAESLRQPAAIGRQPSQQRMCFQCHMPLQCKSGFCFGDFCVKSMVADKYVSKGCENRTSGPRGAGGNGQEMALHGPLYARSALAESGANSEDQQKQSALLKMPIPPFGIAPGCIKMHVFGQPNVICYCNDSDYCNGTRRIGSMADRLLPLILTLIAIWLPMEGWRGRSRWKR